MNKSILVACASSLLYGSITLACEYPQSPTMPNGSTASKEEMIASQNEVKSYIAELEAYQQCLVQEEEAARAETEFEPEVLEQREKVLTKKYNAAHDDMVKIAAEFNEELKEYQSRDGG